MPLLYKCRGTVLKKEIVAAALNGPREVLESFQFFLGISVQNHLLTFEINQFGKSSFKIPDFAHLSSLSAYPTLT